VPPHGDAHSDYFRRRHDLYDIAMSLDADGIAHAMEVTQSLPKSERDWAQPTLIARWLDFDPAAAFSWASALPRGEQRGEMLREFFHSLGLKNAPAALQYLNAFGATPDHGRENYTYSVFEAWSTKRPRRGGPGRTRPGSAGCAQFRAQQFPRSLGRARSAGRVGVDPAIAQR